MEELGSPAYISSALKHLERIQTYLKLVATICKLSISRQKWGNLHEMP